MELTATDLACALLEHAPIQHVKRVSRAIERFLNIGSGARFTATLENNGRYSVSSLSPDEVPRWVWTGMTPDSVTIFTKWGDIIDERTFRGSNGDVLYVNRRTRRKRTSPNSLSGTT